MHDTAFYSEESFTQEQFWRWLQERPGSDVNHYELVGGRIVMTPPAGWPHGGLGSRLNYLLRRHLDAHGLVLDVSTGYELPSGDTLEPDVSFISRERLRAGPKPQPGRLLRVVPSLVIEILSPSTSMRDRTVRKEIYARNGVEEYWIVDPQARNVTVFRLGAPGYGEGAVFAGGAVVSAFLRDPEITVADIFAIEGSSD